MYEQPRSFALNDTSQDQVDRKILPKINTQSLLAEDQARGKNSPHPIPLRIAVAADVAYTLANSGTWQTVSDGRLWRLRVQSPGVLHLSLGITRFDMPEGAKLWIYDPAHAHGNGPYTARNRSHLGSLWTPVIEGDELVVEVFVPTGVAQPVIEITKVNQGYRGLQSGIFGMSEGSCEIDVVCSQGDGWRNQINAVGVYTLQSGGNTYGCTGTLMNDTAFDHKPYILSANHCMVDSTTDASVVFYWNFQSPTCGTHGPGSLAENQIGAIYRASYAPSDFDLFELSAAPDPSFNVYYAGWDATGVAPPSTVVIHHPELDVKAISFSNTPPQSADYLGPLDPSGTHWQVVFNVAGTEDGSSGACLFRSDTQQCIGQNHGGDAACVTANPTDYYGKLSVSWTGGGTPSTRLKDWLDPLNSGVLTNDGDPHITTANGVHYNFQGAGEYVSLRSADGLEIQTREAPVATTTLPGADPYDGLATCVSVNTAVAARVAGHRVTYESNLSGVPDPSGMQLRVDGTLAPLGATPIDLGNGARIATTSAPGGLEIEFPDQNILFATPGWWASQSEWYLDVDLVHAPATDGTSGGSGNLPVPQAVVVAKPSVGGLMAAIPAPSWLPALPDGSLVGPMPSSLNERYAALYNTFGDAWRVTASNSLFDYAPGTSTSTFTIPSWPPQNGPCTLPRIRPVRPAGPGVAERACRQVTGTNAHADCVFDVNVTGNPGFANTYLNGQRVLQNTTPTTAANRKLAVFFDLGAAIPMGTFSSAFNTGLSLNAGLEYMITPYVSVEGIFGFDYFSGKSTGNVDVYQFSVNGKVYLVAPHYKLRPFLNGGVGDYTFSPGFSKFGANVGGGFLYKLTSRFGLQGSYNFQNINTPAAATRFSTLQGGIRLVF